MSTPAPPEQEGEEGIEPPPFFRRWRSAYAVVIGNLLLLIVLFYAFSRLFE
ncbi:MAG: hypothetical protein ABIT01_03545 [Thermoanaerobaculia bacterium]